MRESRYGDRLRDISRANEKRTSIAAAKDAAIVGWQDCPKCLWTTRAPLRRFCSYNTSVSQRLHTLRFLAANRGLSIYRPVASTEPIYIHLAHACDTYFVAFVRRKGALHIVLLNSLALYIYQTLQLCEDRQTEPHQNGPKIICWEQPSLHREAHQGHWKLRDCLQ